jgi:dUTPase
MGREKRARLKKIVGELPKNLSLLTSPRSGLSVKKQIATTSNGYNTYYYRERIGMIM